MQHSILCATRQPGMGDAQRAVLQQLAELWEKADET